MAIITIGSIRVAASADFSAISGPVARRMSSSRAASIW
jgi:hypothetical protein